MQIFAETDRLFLREILPTDADALFELDADPLVHSYLGKRPVTSLNQVEDVIALIRRQYTENGIGRWAVIEKSSNEFVGWSGLKLERQRVNNHIDYYDLGYRLIRRFWGRGYATESAGAALEYGFSTMKLKEIFAAAHIDNAASNRVLQKLGMQWVESFPYDGAMHHWYRVDGQGVVQPEP